MANRRQRREKRRLLIRGRKSGYCAICGQFGKLTRDHIPPKACGNSDDVLVQHYGNLRQPILTSQGGRHCRTICANCNGNLLGVEYDPELVDFSKNVANPTRMALDGPIIVQDRISVTIKPQRVARAVVGHILAANAVAETMGPPDPSCPFPTALREYFLDPSAGMPEGLDLFAWIYPGPHEVLLKNCMKVLNNNPGGPFYLKPTTKGIISWIMGIWGSKSPYCALFSHLTGNLYH